MRSRSKLNEKTRRLVTLELLEDRCLLATLGNQLSNSPNPIDASYPTTESQSPFTSLTSKVIGYDPQTKTETITEGMPDLDLAAADQAAHEAGFDGLKGLLDLIDAGHSPGEFVVGNDDRVLVEDTLAWPYSAVGRIWVKIDHPGGSYQANFTGVLIDSYHVLTSGDCVFTHDYGWASDLRFSAADNGDAILDESGTTYLRRSKFQFFGEAGWTYARTYQGWTQNGNFDFDFGVVTLDRRIGNFTGWYGYGYNPANSFYTSNTATTLDYAQDLTPDFRDMWMDTGNAADVFILPNAMYTSELDRVGSWGQPVSYNTGSGWSVHGVATAEGFGCANPPCTPMPYNITTRIRSSIYNDFGNWRSEDDVMRAPIDRPDLVGLDEWFHSFTSYVSSVDVAEGDPFSVTANIRNNGTATSGEFTVSFYLSNDLEISDSDIYLGTTFVNSLGPLSYSSVPLETIVPNIPADQISPGGQYVLGWTIDAEGFIPEFDETNNAGLYESNLINVQEDDHGNFAGSASVLLPNQLAAGRVEYVGDRDWFSFAGLANTQVTLTTTLGTLADTVLRLYGPDGTTELAVNDNYPGGGLASQIIFTLPTDGTYYAVVEDNGNNAASGSYSLRLTHADDHGNNLGTATLIGAHTLSAGQIEIGGDVDAFTFFAEAGTQITLTTGLVSLSDTTLTLSDVAGNTLAFDDDGGPGLASMITYSVPARGMYVATVAAFGNWQVGSYQLSFDHLDDHPGTSSLATAMTLGMSQPGVVEVNGDQDYFSFQAVAGTAYTLATTLGTLDDSQLVLFDTDGTTLLVSNDNNGINLASRIDWTAPTSGTYFLAVLGKDNSYGSYGLSVNLRTNADGDFNDDGLYDRYDIDLLVAQIASQGNALAFDMNGDNLVNLVDRDLWLAQAGAINLGPGRTYRLGDANLDGVVDGQDFIIWNSHKFTLVPAWSQGDFNADGVVDGADFIAWNGHKFTSSDRPSQPEHFDLELAIVRNSSPSRMQSGNWPTRATSRR